MAIVYLGLGANMGDRKRNLFQALNLMSPQVIVERVSSIYETEPVGFRGQPRFLNAVCRGLTALSPQQLLKLAKEIEANLGRVPSFPDAPRLIDIDLIFYDDIIMTCPELTIPHPRLTDRAFVLVPLAEIAPDLVHPVNGMTVAQLLRKLGKVSGVCMWNGSRGSCTQEA